MSIVYHGGESVKYIVWVKYRSHISNTSKGHFTLLNLVRNGIRSINISRISIFIFVYSHTFYSESVYISGKPLSAERGIVQLNASPRCNVGDALFPRELTNLICEFRDLIPCDRNRSQCNKSIWLADS